MPDDPARPEISMQHTLTLNDIRPRPRIHSVDVFRQAASVFAAIKPIHFYLQDYTAADEEWLVDKFVKEAVSWSKGDTWELASKFSDALNDTVNDDFVILADEFSSFLSKEQDRLQVEWVASGGAVNPVPKASRVVTTIFQQGSDDRPEGIVIPDEFHARMGKTLFLGDHNRENAVDPSGRIISMRIINWEDIKDVLPLQTEDRIILNAHLVAKEEDARRSDASRKKIMVEKACADLLKENTITKEEAERLYAVLGLCGDNIEAARAANAIIMVIKGRMTAI